MISNKPDLIVIGSGLYGLTIARRYVDEFDGRVLIIEKRKHIGGNAWSTKDKETGIEIHNYGSHLFHTSNKKVIEFLNRFTSFNDYKHTVYSVADGKIYSMPFNLMTISQVFNKSISPEEAKIIIYDEIKSASISKAEIEKSLEHKALSSIGKTLYELLVKGYTKKQWQINPTELPANVIARLPIRYNFNNSYFFDKFQGLPLNGYAEMLTKISNHPRIEILLDCDYFESEWKNLQDVLKVYTGPVDKYFSYTHGMLQWRTLDFEIEKLHVDDYQGAAVVNYADENIPYTRIHEFKHLHPEREYLKNQTIIMKEYSRLATGIDEPYYPVNSATDRENLLKYRELAKAEKNVIFGGRLGTYKYLDMDMAIASALTSFEQEIISVLKK